MISDLILELLSVPVNTFMRFVDSSAHRVLNMHHQASPVSRTPSMPAVDPSYIPPVPPLIQDYRPYYPTPNDLSGMYLSGGHLQLLRLLCVANDAWSALQS